MRSGQREFRLAVIEFRSRPLRGRVAKRAILRESRCHMVRIGGLLVVGQVARSALRGQPRVLPRRVALRARQRHMRSGQREFRLAVIELRPGPLRGGVADSAILREARRHVVRVGRLLIVGQVARTALRGQACVLARRVALRAGHRHVRSGQREFRFAVIELRPGPLRGGVADGAVLRESRCHVVRVGGLLIVGQVARTALRGQACVLARRVALGTRQRHMRSGQRELRFAVIELRPGPLRGGVADSAVLRESRRRVVRIGGLLIAG